MKLTFLTIPLLLLFFNQLSAQWLHVRPEIGMNIATVKNIYTNISVPDKNINESVTGMKAGAYIKIPLAKNIYLEPGLLYSRKGWKMKNLVLEFNLNPAPGVGRTTIASLFINTMELPINLNYDIHLKKAGILTVFAGPYFGYEMRGRTKLESGSYTEVRKLKAEKGHSIELGINAGICYQAPFGLYARVQYGMGIHNQIPGYEYRSNPNRVLGISLGYDLPFHIKKKNRTNTGSGSTDKG